MRMLVFLLLAVMGAIQDAAAQAASLPGQHEPPELASVAPADILVEVFWRTSWGLSESTSLDGTGRFTFAASLNGHLTSTQASIGTTVARYLFSRLVAMGFFDLRARYDSTVETLRETPDGRVVIDRHELEDSGGTQVTLKFGGREHAVYIGDRARSAPAQLVDWCSELRDLASNEATRR